MKVCTDSCLFGALIDVQNTDTVLDIGAGTGLLSLMLAQKGAEYIDAIELDIQAAKQATQNISDSKFKNQISLYNQSIQEFAQQSEKKYSLIISNPPFFTNSLKSLNDKKNAAHHTTTLSANDLMQAIHKILKKDGVAWLLLSPYEMTAFQNKAEQYALNFYIRYEMFDRVDKHIRSIVCLSFTEKNISTEKIIIYNTDRTYTEDFIHLMQPYYLYL
jgi:tRNA1Val (adenine37-N6)-methyltransferase